MRKRRFVADASHELRTPLATIRGRSDVLLLSPTLDPEAREGLAMIRDEAGRMARLTDLRTAHCSRPCAV